MRFLQTEYEKQAARALEDSLAEHEPQHVFLLFSGGHDSLVSTHLSNLFLRSKGMDPTVLHIDTTIGVPENEQFVTQAARDLKWALRIIRNEEHDGKSYTEWVLEEGFPTPSDHVFVYAHLKREAIRQVVREEKEEWSDRVLFVTGVYAGESGRRAGFHEPEKRVGAQVWLNPCFEWSESQMAGYRHRHYLPTNELAAEYGTSPECLCGAFAHPGDLEAVEHLCPALAAKIRKLDEMTTEAGYPWSWDHDEIPERWKQEKEGQTSLFEPLCTDCG